MVSAHRTSAGRAPATAIGPDTGFDAGGVEPRDVGDGQLSAGRVVEDEVHVAARGASSAGAIAFDQPW